MISVKWSKIVVVLDCDECGHQWDVDDEDSLSVSDAEEQALAEGCPNCKESEDD